MIKSAEMHVMEVNPKQKICEKRLLAKGQIALPFMLLVCGIIIEVSIAGAFIVYYLTNSEAGERFALRAYAVAEAGIQDAILQVARNKEYNISGSTSTYSVTLGSDSSAVTVYRYAGSAADSSYVYTLTSTGVSMTRKKKIRAEMVVVKETGEVQLKSLQEEAVE